MLSPGLARRISPLLTLLLPLLSLGAHADTFQRGIFHLTFNPSDRQVAEQSLAALEEATAEFATRLPAGDQPIHVLIAHTITEFIQHAGRFSHVNVSGVARSSQGRIILQAPRLRKLGGDYRGTVRHELVHILLHRNTDTGSLPRWLNEGIAMSLANEHRWNSTLTVAQMFLRRHIIEFRDLDRAFLAPGDEMEFGDAYAQALSMTRYLRDRLGEDAFWAVVLGCRNESFGDALRRHAGFSPRDLWQGYRRSLWLIALIGALTSGSVFTPAAFLLLIAYWRKRRGNQRILRRWAREEAQAPPEELFSWDAIVDDPDAWKDR